MPIGVKSKVVPGVKHAISATSWVEMDCMSWDEKVVSARLIHLGLPGVIFLIPFS